MGRLTSYCELFWIHPGCRGKQLSPRPHCLRLPAVRLMHLSRTCRLHRRQFIPKLQRSQKFPRSQTLAKTCLHLHPPQSTPLPRPRPRWLLRRSPPSSSQHLWRPKTSAACQAPCRRFLSSLSRCRSQRSRRWSLHQLALRWTRAHHHCPPRGSPPLRPPWPWPPPHLRPSRRRLWHLWLKHSPPHYLLLWCPANLMDSR